MNLFWKVVEGKHPLPNAARLLGWQFIYYDARKCQVYIAFNATPSLANPMGNIQGGMLTAMLDDVMGPAVYANLTDNQVAVTIELKTHFIKPALPGRIIGCGQIVQADGENRTTSGELINEDGKVLATATATYRIVTWDMDQKDSRPRLG
jgi:uncharacterized protein (TIGR00369 family)